MLRTRSVQPWALAEIYIQHIDTNYCHMLVTRCFVCVNNRIIDCLKHINTNVYTRTFNKAVSPEEVSQRCIELEIIYGKKVIIWKATDLVCFNVLPQHSVGETEGNMRNLSQNIQIFKLHSSKIQVWNIIPVPICISKFLCISQVNVRCLYPVKWNSEVFAGHISTQHYYYFT